MYKNKTSVPVLYRIFVKLKQKSAICKEIYIPEICEIENFSFFN